MLNPSPIARLHYLTQDAVPHRTHEKQVEIACQNGVKWVQLRIKEADEKEILAIAKRVREITSRYHAKLIVNDYVHIAKEVRADGVHLGKKDMFLQEARKILPSGMILGGTANEEADILRLIKDGAAYIGLGPYRYTSTKKNLSPVLGFEKIKALLPLQKTVPFIIIGGINLEDAGSILEAGAWGLAVSSAINLAPDMEKAVQEFLNITKET